MWARFTRWLRSEAVIDALYAIATTLVMAYIGMLLAYRG